MNTDIRILTTLRSSRKRKRFESILGPNTIMHIIDLWLTVAIERPDGILTGWDDVDIALAANWPGDPAEFMRVAMLEHCSWIDLHDGVYRIHDWEEHQGWACGAKERSEKAKNAAKTRWEKRLNGKGGCEKTEENQGSDAASNAQAMLKHPSSNAPSPSPSPSPSPYPSLKEKKQKLSASGDAAPALPEKFYLTRKKRKLTGKRLETFERFWAAFRYPKGKAEAADAWYDIPQITDSLVEKIIEAAEAEATARHSLIADGRTPKMAQGWISGKRWEDEAEISEDAGAMLQRLILEERKKQGLNPDGTPRLEVVR